LLNNDQKLKRSLIAAPVAASHSSMPCILLGDVGTDPRMVIWFKDRRSKPCGQALHNGLLVSSK